MSDGVHALGRDRPPSDRIADMVSVEGLRRLGVRPPLRTYLRDLWVRRDLAVSMPLGELKSRHMNSFLGSTWHLLNPLLMMLVYFLVFGKILTVGRGIDNYVIFLLIGLITFFYTQKATISGMKAIVGNLKLLQSLNFPRAIMPMTTVISEALAQIPAIGLVLAFALATGEAPVAVWALVLPILVVQTVMNVGIACFTARLSFHFRDMEQLLPYVTRIWFYLSGVIFAAERVPDGWARTVFEANPPYAFIHLTRLAVMDGTTDARFWYYAVAWAVVLAIVGLVFFWQHEHEYGHG